MKKKYHSYSKKTRLTGLLMLIMIIFSCVTPAPIPENEPGKAIPIPGEPGDGSPVQPESQEPGDGSPVQLESQEPGDGSLVQPESQEPGDGSPVQPESQEPGDGSPVQLESQEPGDGSPVQLESQEPGDGSLVHPVEPEAFSELVPETWGLGEPSPSIDAPGIKSPYQLYQFFMANNPDADELKVARLASYYVEEGLAEGINSDVAFVQMCLETGWLSFGNLVTVEMNNFCGLGAIDAEHRGNVFETERMGVRAHIQHLHAYGTTRELNRTCIDDRYKWVNPRGKAPTVEGLSGTWAADRTYGAKLQNLLNRLAEF